MGSTKHARVIYCILGLLAVVEAHPNCITYGKKDVVCTAGNTDYILGRGLVSDNNITTGITLRDCRITDVDYEAFKNDFNLKYIDLSRNRIERLKLGVLDENHQVTYLNLSYNLLTTFPLGLFDQKPNLDVLDLKENRLNHLETGVFDLLGKLAYLDLSSNALLGKSMMPRLFEKNIKIKFMDFSRNDMSDSSDLLLNSFLDLDFLNLDRCSLKEVPSFATRPNLKTMKHLMLSTNQISKIDQSNTFMHLDDLEILNFADNFIEELDAEVFHPLRKLQKLVFRNNRLKKLPDVVFRNMPKLMTLDLSYNIIEYVPINAFRGSVLKHLNLSHNRFSFLEPNFCLELKNSGVPLNKIFFNDNPWQCACLNELLKEVKSYMIRYNSAKYTGDRPVCVTAKTFTCKRQLVDNAFFVEMYDTKIKGKK